MSRRLRRGSANCLMRATAASQPFVGGRLGDERERAAGQAVLAVVVEGHELHRDVAGRRVLLQAGSAPVQPSMSGRKTSREIAVGWNSLRQRQRVGAATWRPAP